MIWLPPCFCKIVNLPRVFIEGLITLCIWVLVILESASFELLDVRKDLLTWQFLLVHKLSTLTFLFLKEFFGNLECVLVTTVIIDLILLLLK